MKPTSFVLAALVTLSAVPTVSFAQDTLAFNAALSSEYRFRGISQSRFDPAFSAGADYVTKDGFYVGAWASTIKWIEDLRGDSNIELDLYAGYRAALSETMGYDVGVLQYVYPSAQTAAWDASFKNPNTTEIYGAITTAGITGKLSYSLTNLFGNYDFTNNRDSKGSYYLDLSAPFPLGSGFTLTPHVGYQKVENIANASYTDYALTVSKDIEGFSLSASIIGTNAKKAFYTAPNTDKNLGRSVLVVAAKYNF